jgi:hypothetical protein
MITGFQAPETYHVDELNAINTLKAIAAGV